MKIYRIKNSKDFSNYDRETAIDRKGLLGSNEKNLFTIKGYSYPAKRQVDFVCNAVNIEKKIVNWRETLLCPITKLNSRSRYAIQIIDIFSNSYYSDDVYIMEQKTPLFKFFKNRYNNLVGSEYLGLEVGCGSLDGMGIRNEDATNLSFSDESLDMIMSFDVFEHIYNFEKAFKECFRVLRKGGKLFFTVPFLYNQEASIQRALALDNGEIEHILPAEFHGDPLSKEGVLCFRHFGWDMIADLKAAGFKDAYALMANSLEFGYVANLSVFCATKAE